MKKVKKILIFSVIAAIVIATAVFHYDSKKMLVYKDNLNKTAVTVDGQEISLAELAFYIAYEETTIEDQAMIYSPENPNSYWNLHINGQFVQVAGKQAAMDMAVHDIIFAVLAEKESITLSEEDVAAVDSKESDFWSDLTDHQKESLGVTEDQIYDSMTKLALAQKYQTFLAGQSGMDYESYDISGKNYKELLEDHKVKQNKKVWEKIDFGNIVVEH